MCIRLPPSTVWLCSCVVVIEKPGQLYFILTSQIFIEGYQVKFKYQGAFESQSPEI